MDTLLAELVDIAFEVSAGVLPQHALQNPQVSLVVDLGAGLEGLEWLDHLDR